MSLAFTQGGSGDWQRVTAKSPCPICGKPDWCLVSADGALAVCPRTPEGATKDLGEAGFLHRVGDAPGFDDSIPRVVPKFTPPPAVPVKRTTANLQDLQARCRKFAVDRLEPLAKQLGVSTAVLNQLEFGYCEQDQCWTVPERDAHGQIIGIHRRFPDGSKRRLDRSKAGLTYALNWDTGAGPLLLVEGGSDVAAAMMLQLTVIGRPSNFGGRALLGEMLLNFPEHRPIIVVGERDKKPDGRWPGKEGAVTTATDLAKRLGRPVQWALPPDKAKDVRAWVNEHAPNQPAAMGELFLEGLNLETVLPPPRQRLKWEELPPLEAQDYRQQMLQLRLRSLDIPGIYLDRSGTGHGKSSIDFEVICRMSNAERN